MDRDALTSEVSGNDETQSAVRKTDCWVESGVAARETCRGVSLPNPLRSLSRDDAHVPRRRQPHRSGGQDTAAHGYPESGYVVPREVVQNACHPRTKGGT